MRAIDPTLQAIALLRLCANGFRDHFHHAGWKRKHNSEIQELPPPLRAAVLFSWEQATMSEKDAIDELAEAEETERR